jgi:DNA-binding NtrC family response regulator
MDGRSFREMSHPRDGGGSAVSAEKPLVVVLEDDEFVSVGTEVNLEDLGFRTLSAASVEEALDHLRLHPSVTLLLADIGIGRDRTAGLVVAMEAVTIQPHLGVLYVSGQGLSDEIRQSFVKRSGFLSKPFTARQLRAAVEAVLALPPLEG